jgi:hypothetical protein
MAVRRRFAGCAEAVAEFTLATIVPSVEPIVRATPVNKSSSLWTAERRVFFKAASVWHKSELIDIYRRPSNKRISKTATMRPIPPLG